MAVNVKATEGTIELMKERIATLGNIQKGAEMKLHQCHVCKKSFPSPYKLKRHHVIHTGQKPFVCTTCGKAFSQSTHLKLHWQKVHPSRPQTGPQDLQDGILTGDQHANCAKPAAGVNTHGSGNDTVMPLPVSSSSTSQTRWKRKIVTGICMPFVNNGSVTLDAVPQEQVDSADGDTSVRSASKGYTCKVCLKSFRSSLQLWTHSQTHNKSKQYEMGRESGKTYSKGHLQSQKVSSGRGKMTLKHQCPKCLKTFCTPSKLQRHFLIHTGQKPYSCKICFKSFRQKEHLKSHLNTPNKCLLSAGTENKKRCCHSRQTSGLQPQSAPQQRLTCLHTRTNSSMELELQCKISVNAVQDLNTTDIKSEAVVKQEQPLNASSQCQSTHHKSDEQEQQHSTHEDVKPFQCMICNRSFRLKVNLIRHHKIHGNQKESESLTSVQNAVKHSPEPLDLNIIVKPETWSPNGSDYSDSLPQGSGLITASEQLRETCSAISKWQRITSLPQCHTCLKFFPCASKLQRHMMTHTGQRPFGCETCGKRFRQKAHLRVHCRTHLRSRYHKQRSLYINRQPSHRGRFNTRTAADLPLQETLIDKKDFQTHTGSDVISVKHLDEKSKPSKPVSQRGNIRKGKAHSQPQTYPRISVHIPQQKKSANTDNTVSNSDCAEGNGVSAKVNSLLKTNSKSNKKRKVHTCRICFKNFPVPTKLSRHMVTHSGVRPYKCSLCNKTFTQQCHLKTHQLRCRYNSRICDCFQEGTQIPNHLQDKCSVNLSDLNVDATRGQSHYASAGHSSCTDGDLSFCSEAKQTERLVVPKVEENNEPEKMQRDSCNQTTDNYNYSFPSELAFEMNKLVQNQNMAPPPLSHWYKGNAHTVATTCPPNGVAAISDSNKLLSDEFVNPVAESQMQPDDYWCEPIIVFNCGNCTASFKSQNDLKQHICSANVQPEMTESAHKNCCDICFKQFVTPSKLKRHYVTHTGQRPFSCDMCGKTFSQAAHARKHRLTH